MTEKKISITHHIKGWGIIFLRSGSLHFWEKDSWKCICGKIKLNDISDRWKVKFIPKNNNNFPERKKCGACLRLMELMGIIED